MNKEEEEKNGDEKSDLMEQVRHTNYDAISLFKMCKRQVLDIISNVSFHTNDFLFFNKLLKHFGLSFSQEIQDIILGKYDNTHLDIMFSGEKLTKIQDAIEELLQQNYFIYDDYYNRLCGNVPHMHAKWLIDENNFNKTLCNFIKACEMFNIYGDKETLIKRVAELLEDFYDIRQDNSAEFGYRVIPKHNIEIIKDLENEPSLQNVMKYYYQNDIGKALAELRKITEFSSKKNTEFTKFILSQGEDLQEMCKKVYKFITTYENHLAENANATETEARIWLDLGLSIYRLYLMNSK